MIREMVNEFGGVEFYRSSFDMKNGNLVRATVEPNEEYSGGFRSEIVRDLSERETSPFHKGSKFDYAASQKAWEKKFGKSCHRDKAWSPSPETIDIKLTKWCDFGCPYCYMDSRKTTHSRMSVETLEFILNSFNPRPYQVAYGGGEPVAHPDFPEILKLTRKLDVVPNFTTAGHIWREEVINAANEYCGGIAITYHAFKGIGWFCDTYLKWRNNFTKQLNIHLVAGKGAANHLRELTRAALDSLGPLSVTLLAYYPNIGRSDYSGLMPKNEYMNEFPLAIKEALGAGIKIAFSEGLLPYFLSRPEIGVDTSMALPQEGRFSCYINEKGWLAKSSFDSEERLAWHFKDTVPAKLDYPQLWNNLWGSHEPGGESCFECRFKPKCSAPESHHYFICAYALNNGGNPPPSDRALRDRAFWEEIRKPKVE